MGSFKDAFSCLAGRPIWQTLAKQACVLCERNVASNLVTLVLHGMVEGVCHGPTGSKEVSTSVVATKGPLRAPVPNITAVGVLAAGLQPTLPNADRRRKMM